MTVFLKNLDLSKIKSQSRRSNKSNRPPITSFPVKLFRMLEAVEQEGLEHVVSWHPDGSSFQVHDVQKFVEVVLPSHFKQTKYKSFQRQLNFYGFQRITSGPLEGSYKHASFIKGNEALSREIRRQTQHHSKSVMAVSNHDNGSDYESSSENSEADNTTPAPVVAPDQYVDMAEKKSDAFSYGTSGRRDSLQIILEAAEEETMPTFTPSEAFHQNMSDIPAFDSGRRAGFKEGTRLSFVGKKFHFLPVEFTDLYGA